MSRRCSECGRHWPYTSVYARCPVCQIETRHDPADSDYSHDEARAIFESELQYRRRKAEFEKYYVERAVAQLTEELDDELGKLCRLPTK